MATKSFYKNVVISNNGTCRSFVSALEKAQKCKGKTKVTKKEVSTVKKDELKEFFSNQ